MPPSAAPSVWPSPSLGALLAWREGTDAIARGHLGSEQLAAGRRAALPLLGVHLAALALLAIVLAGPAPTMRLAVWVAAASGCSLVFALRRAWTRADAGAATTQVRVATLEAAVLALVWGVPPLVLPFGAGVAPAYWMIVAALMTATAVVLAPLFATATAFVVVLGATLATPLAWTGGYSAAAATLLFSLLLVLVGRDRALALMRDGAVHAALAERDETVSLLLREFEEANSDWLWETDAARRIVRATPRFARACGFEPATIEGMPLLQVLAGPTWEGGNFSAGLRGLSEKLKHRESFRDLALPVTVDNQERWWELAATPRHSPAGDFVGFRGVASDVTERRASADKINRMARFDTLTGLPNRLFVNEALARALTEADKWRSHCAFMMIDLDRFKAVNDTLGHPIGDRLLGRVSERLAQLMSENELIGRLGGDEFAVVVRDAGDPDRLERLARTIIDALSRPYDVDQHTLYIGASIGIATSPRDGHTPETLIRSADLALYRSKDGGGGIFHAYEPQLHVEAEERRVIETALRQALDNGELHLAYQPVVDAGQGALRGFEALLRWTHPELGVVPPAKFISVAEEARLIAPIGEWVIRTACAEAAGWPGDLRVAVNVSPQQLTSPGFVAIVANALGVSGLAPHRLEIEVTERVFLRESVGAQAALNKILALGVLLSLDDFGTGSCSLGYLSRTRFSSIKIDRTFVRDAARGAQDALAIIRAVVALTQSLGVATTAEGVETSDELMIVRTLGCTHVQGHLFGRPLPVDEARALTHQTRQTVRAA